MTDLGGQTIKGYEFIEKIGAGGFGAVYRAHQPLLKREVAIKVILPQHANQPDFIRRFEVEAELVARLEHPHIIPLFDYWREPGGAYLVMRWLRGGSLRQVLPNGPLEVEQAALMLDQITAALAVAHRNGVIHRDIKPDNILLDEDGNAYLADFGIAKSPDVKSKSGDDTITGSIQYISPEQIQGNPVTPETDIYSLGIVLYETLTAQHPFGTATVSGLVFKHLQEPLPDITLTRADLPGGVNEVIQKATAKNPADRYPEVQAFAAAFRAAITKEAVAAVSTPILDIDKVIDLVNPYKGLRPFQEADAGDFFGRAALVERLLARLAEPEDRARFLAVVGPSGSGKSSVVKAGLIPALRRGDLPDSDKWFIVEMYPGTHPMEELEAALLRIAVNPPQSLLGQLREDQRGLVRAIKRILPPEDEAELLVVIDQFEELFTLVEDGAARTHFLDSLLTALADPRSRLRVIVTLRADFYDKPLQYRDFGEMVRKHTEIVLPMSPEELEQAIGSPAEQVGTMLEPGMVQAIVKDVGEQPGTLPLLQYALTELFERRRGRVLTLEAYNEIGGVTGALARRAEEIFSGLDDEDKEATRQLFLRLVTLGEGPDDTRRRVRQSELVAGDGVGRVIDAYGKARLLTFDRDPVTRGPTVEVAHEALIRTWARLKEWVAVSRDDLRIQRQLTQATAEWLESGRAPGFLAREARLLQFEFWAIQTDLALNPDEQAYLDISIADREKREQADRERKAHEARIARRAQTFRRASIVLGGMVILASVATLIAILTTRDAQATQATVEWQATYFALEQGWAATLAAGGVVVPVVGSTHTPADFIATATQIAELNQWKPVVEQFNGIEMVLVPAGCFMMGSTFVQDEQPVQEICFDEPFWIDRYEVTRAQYRLCVDAGACTEAPVTGLPAWRSEPTKPYSWRDQQPVNHITWFQARDHCAWRGVRLPTEAEWEYAARGPDSLVYPWGNEFVADNVVFWGNSNEVTADVGSRPGGMSWVGAYDMIGNVYEWTSTIYREYPYDPDDGRESDGDTDSGRVLRSGSFWDGEGFQRATGRLSNIPENATILFGFRCACSYDQP